MAHLKGLVIGENVYATFISLVYHIDMWPETTKSPGESTIKQLDMTALFACVFYV